MCEAARFDAAPVRVQADVHQDLVLALAVDDQGSQDQARCSDDPASRVLSSARGAGLLRTCREIA